MCLDTRAGGRVGRRAFLAGGAATVASALAVRSPAAAAPGPDPVAVAPGLLVHPRDAWGADLPAPDDLPTEADGDVRVLVVHHSASGNGYAEADVANEIRNFYAMHTGPQRKWPDVAYNFFVDRFGGVWEGRAGSLERPVIGDATSGNQGFSQLVCLVGNHVSEPPSDEAVDSLSRVLAWLARREGVDVTPGAVATFTSRGSNLWPAGATVRTSTIAGHRDLSRTACPGDAAYARVTGDLPSLVAQRLAEQEAAERATASTAPPATSPPGTPPATPAPAETGGDAVAAPARTGSGGGQGASPFRVPFLAAGAAVTAIAVPMALRRRRAEGGPDGAAPAPDGGVGDRERVSRGG